MVFRSGLSEVTNVVRNWRKKWRRASCCLGPASPDEDASDAASSSASKSASMAPQEMTLWIRDADMPLDGVTAPRERVNTSLHECVVRAGECVNDGAELSHRLGVLFCGVTLSAGVDLSGTEAAPTRARDLAARPRP